MLHAASAPQQPPARRRLLGITGRGGRELLDTERPADRVEGGGDMHVRVGVQAAGDGAGVYAMVTVIPSQVDGWHAPLAALTCESWPLAPSCPGQADQTERSADQLAEPGVRHVPAADDVPHRLAAGP